MPSPNVGRKIAITVDAECTVDTRKEGSEFVPYATPIRALVKSGETTVGEVVYLPDGSANIVVFDTSRTESWRIAPGDLWTALVRSLIGTAEEA